ncbi:MAG: hypothetical protein Q9178_003515 [Gyalolechia marmorata]
MTPAFVPILVLVSFLTAIGSLNYPVAAMVIAPECWPGISMLQPIIFKECLDTINQELLPPGIDPNIPLKFSRDFRLNPDVSLPYFWKSQGGNCVVGVDFERSLDGYDRTTLNDIKRVAMAIARKCVISPPHLGGIVEPVGWQRKLTVTMGGFNLPADKILNDSLSSE